MLVFNAHLEAVLPVDLRKVIGDLEGLADLVRGQEGVAAECRQSTRRDGRKAAVFSRLRNVQNSILRRNAVSIGFRRGPRGVKVVEPHANLVGRAWREYVSPCHNRLV